MEQQNNGVYGVSSFLDYRDARLYEYDNQALRHKLLNGIEAALFSPGKHVVEITREVSKDTLPYSNLEKVTYKARITEVQVREYAEIQMLPYYPAKGRNHRKKDRARARQRRALQRKLRERMKHE